MSRGWVNFYTHTSCFSWISLHAIQMVPCAAWFTLAVGPKDERGSAVVETKSRHVFERTGDQSLPWVREDEVVEHFASLLGSSVLCAAASDRGPQASGVTAQKALSEASPRSQPAMRKVPEYPRGGRVQRAATKHNVPASPALIPSLSLKTKDQVRRRN